MSRCALMRPAMRKLAPSANFSRTRAISPEVSKAAPKGATPSLSKAANFSRRNASNSLSVCSMPASDSKQNQDDEQIEWVASASHVLVSAARRNNLFKSRESGTLFTKHARGPHAGGQRCATNFNIHRLADREGREHSAGSLGFRQDRHLPGQIRLEMEGGQ